MQTHDPQLYVICALANLGVTAPEVHLPVPNELRGC